MTKNFTRHGEDISPSEIVPPWDEQDDGDDDDDGQDEAEPKSQSDKKTMFDSSQNSYQNLKDGNVLMVDQVWLVSHESLFILKV